MSKGLMTLELYAPKAMETATAGSIYLWGLGLAGETFELLRAMDGDGNVTLEAGDVLWYCVATATCAGVLPGFITHFQRYPTCAPDLRTSLYQSVGDTVEHIKKALRANKAVDPEFMVPALSKVARTLYWITDERGIEWYQVMDRNLQKLSARKASGTIVSR